MRSWFSVRSGKFALIMALCLSIECFHPTVAQARRFGLFRGGLVRALFGGRARRRFGRRGFNKSRRFANRGFQRHRFEQLDPFSLGRRPSFDPFLEQAFDPSLGLRRLADFENNPLDFAEARDGRVFELEPGSFIPRQEAVFADGSILGGAVIPLRGDDLEEAKLINEGGLRFFSPEFR